MTNETREKIDNFLVKHGYDLTELKTEKDKIEKLWAIALNAGVDKDCEITDFEKKREQNNTMSEEEYSTLVKEHLSSIQNFELIDHNARVYIAQIKFERKEERKLLRKQKIQKVLSIFKFKKR